MSVNFEEILTRGYGSKWEKFAHVSNSPNCGNTFGLHAYQFVRAAEILVEAWNKSRAQTLELPIAYTCRHYLELSLKGAWEDCGRAGFDASTIPVKHDLLELWNPIRRFCIAHAIFSEDDELIGSFEEIVVFLNDLDQRSTAFRYPLADRQIHLVIDVQKLWEAMDLCETFFFGLDAMTSHY